MNLWERFSFLRRRSAIAEAQAHLGQMEVVNGRSADVLRARLGVIRDELYAAQIVAQEMAGEIERLSLPASKAAVGGRDSGAAPVPGDAVASPGENSEPTSGTASRNARRSADGNATVSGAADLGELENAGETESRGDVGRESLGGAHNPIPRGARLLDDKEQYEDDGPKIHDVRL